MASTPRPNPNAVRSFVKHRVALVTGAARGIGFATAALLAQHGARVVLVDLHEEESKKACAEIGQKASWQVCDVTSRLHCSTNIKKTVGSISMLVCNAAVNPEVALLQTLGKEKYVQSNSQVRYNYLADERLRDDTPKRPSTKLIDINANSVIFGLKFGIHHTKQYGVGSIVGHCIRRVLPSGVLAAAVCGKQSRRAGTMSGYVANQRGDRYHIL
ncbi:hypothetical protein N7537_010795 [Penicillium hordei]|jgi:Dehydrogenases with different specificities (related to short-chain alcohol dehydrogenases)|uniref:Uncharacterized protein n=1 Tax=Penicillium hordei TaxID=40994 RepID=A0AAD6DLX2_9EURO|nr:uncharacterized protein N7537_010795 [Penicillium hordei]KAJ5588117.1 hypothetical protein N7537_010795 [Penicillium hordei]